MCKALVIKTKRRGHTLAVYTARAQRYEAIARQALRDLVAAVPEEERAGLSRAVVQEAVRLDADTRGRDDAQAWAAKQARAA